jgi:hypothetical protein
VCEHVHLCFGLPLSGGDAASVSAAETTITTAATAAVVLRKLAAEPMNAATMACCEPLFAVACSLLEAELTSPTPLAVTLAEEEQLKERITGLQHLLECVTVLAPALLSAVVAVSDNPQTFEEKWIAQGQLMRFEVQPCLAGGRAEHWKRCAQLLYRCAVLALNIPPTLLPDQMHPALATQGARMLGCIAVANAICWAEHKPPATSLSALPGFGWADDGCIKLRSVLMPLIDLLRCDTTEGQEAGAVALNRLLESRVLRAAVLAGQYPEAVPVLLDIAEGERRGVKATLIARRAATQALASLAELSLMARMIGCTTSGSAEGDNLLQWVADSDCLTVLRENAGVGGSFFRVRHPHIDPFSLSCAHTMHRAAGV